MNYDINMQNIITDLIQRIQKLEKQVKELTEMSNNRNEKTDLYSHKLIQVEEYKPEHKPFHGYTITAKEHNK